MKKQLKKLSLSKETLRNLSGHEMKGVVGGVTNTCCNSSGGTVDTCTPTCNTRWCSADC
jgi:hypothetical protein